MEKEKNAINPKTYDKFITLHEDLINFNDLFHVAIGGIEMHLTHDVLDKEYVVNTLLGLSRNIEFMLKEAE